MATRQFKSVNYIHPTPITPGEQIQVEWFFEDLKKDEIDVQQNGRPAVIPGCNCTADVDILDDRIVATYTDNTDIDKVEKAPNRELQIGKNLRVFLKDGQPLRAKNNRGAMGWNVNGKENIILTFNVNVQV